MLPILLGIGLMAGCGSRELIVLLPSEEGKTGRLAVSNEDGNTVVLDSPLAAAEVDGSGTASVVSLSTLSLRNAFGAMPSAMPKAPISYVVYFKFSTVALTDESQRELHTALADLRERAGAEVEVIGHTDSVGADEDNDRLSLERARAVAVMLRANAVDGSLISVSGRGERELLIATGDNVRAARNRRVEILVR